MDVHLMIHGRHDLAGQLYRQLRTAILDGRLVPGERLPSIRDLALQIGVSRKTTLDVFERLIAEGYLQPHTGSGTFVTEATEGLHAHTPVASPAAQLTSPTPAVRTLDTPWNNMPAVLPLPRVNLVYDFVGGMTEKCQFPFDVWRRRVAYTLRQQTRGCGGYQNPAGDQAPHLATSRYPAFSCAMVCAWADIVVTQDAQQAIDLIARVLVRPGDTAAVEDPGYPPAHIALQTLGVKVVLVPANTEGLVVDALPKRVKLVYVTPSYQFPLDMPVSLARRAQLLGWAQRHDALIIGDDYDSGFRFDGRPMGSLKSLDAAGCVTYVGTFLKTIFPELHIGYVVPPTSLVASLQHVRQVAGWYSESLMQAVLAKLMFDGNFAKYLRRVYKEYVARRNALLRHLRDPLVPWLVPVPSAAGIHMAAQVQTPLAETELVKLTESVGVGLYGIARMLMARPPQPGLLIGYGHVNVVEIDAGLDKLAEVPAKVAT